MCEEMYSKLQQATDATFCDAAMVAFEQLAEVDPEPVQLMTELYGTRISAAIRCVAGWDRRSTYAELSAG